MASLPADKREALKRNPQWSTLILPWLEANLQQAVPVVAAPVTAAPSVGEFSLCDVSVNGDYTAKGNIILTGEINGDLKMKAFELIVRGGTIGGDVTGAKSVRIESGTIGGDVTCIVFEQTGGTVGGDVASKTFNMTGGSIGGDVVTDSIISARGRIGGDLN